MTGVIITNPGSGYLASDPPVVTFSGGGGTGAIGRGATLTTAVSGAMEFNLTGTSNQLSGRYSGIWAQSSDACSIGTRGVISWNRS